MNKDTVSGAKEDIEMDYASQLLYAVPDFSTPLFWSRHNIEGYERNTAGPIDVRGNVEESNVVRNRRWFYDEPRCISADRDSNRPGCKFAEASNTILVVLLTNIDEHLFGVSFEQSNLGIAGGEITRILQTTRY